MLLKRKMNPKGYEKIMMLKDHLEERNDKFQHVGIQMLNVVMLLQEACSEPQFTNQEIQRMIGILRTNGMKLLPHGTKAGIQGVALYPIYCLINHACINNTNYVKYPDYHLEVRSQLPIKKGEEIYTRYISSTIGNKSYNPFDVFVQNYHFICRYCMFKWYCRKFSAAGRHQKVLVF